MGVLVCSRCKARTEADSIEKGRKRLDHGIGLYIGKPCEDGKAELFFIETTQKAKKTSSTTTTKKIDKHKTAKSKSD